MARRPSIVTASTAIGLAALTSACSGGPTLPTLQGGTVPSIAAPIVAGSLQGEPGRISASSAEVYSRIARGANACWFGPRGRFGRTHILHADAAPSMNGGGVEMVVHERAADQPKPWGYKAFRVVLTESAGMDGSPGGGGTSIEVENTRMPEAEAQRMRAEVFMWASAGEGCRNEPGLSSPVEAPVSPPPAPARARSTSALGKT